MQYFLRGTVRDTVNPKDMWYGGANYRRISCMGVPKRGDVRITVTLELGPSYESTAMEMIVIAKINDEGYIIVPSL